MRTFRAEFSPFHESASPSVLLYVSTLWASLNHPSNLVSSPSPAPVPATLVVWTSCVPMRTLAAPVVALLPPWP